MIRPFPTRLDIEVPFLFYSVPFTNPAGPITVFTDRFWDQREHWSPPGVGTVPNSFKVYFGQTPGPEVSPMEGTADQWENGIDYDTWFAGGYPASGYKACMPVFRAPMKQVQRLFATQANRASWDQTEQFSVFPAAGQLHQKQSLTAFPPTPPMMQKQTLAANLSTGALHQKEQFAVYPRAGLVVQGQLFAVNPAAGGLTQKQRLGEDQGQIIVTQAQRIQAYAATGKLTQAERLNVNAATGKLTQAQLFAINPRAGQLTQSQQFAVYRRAGQLTQKQAFNYNPVYTGPVRRQVASTVSINTHVPVVTTFPQTTLNGSFLYLTCYTLNKTLTVTGPVGFNAGPTIADSTGKIWTFYKYNAAPTATLQTTHGVPSASVFQAVCELTGVSTTGTLDFSASSTGSSAPPIVLGPAGPTAVTNEFAIATYATSTFDGAIALTVAPWFTLQPLGSSPNAGSMAFGATLGPTGGYFTFKAYNSVSANWSFIFSAFKY